MPSFEIRHFPNEDWEIGCSETWLYTCDIHFLGGYEVDSENGRAGGIFDNLVLLSDVMLW